nr:hypothetical protein [Tanacetum cinerariifolium]
MYTYLAMANYPYPSDIDMPLHAYLIKEVCKAIDDAPDETSILDHILKGATIYYNYTRKFECFELDDDPYEALGIKKAGQGIQTAQERLNVEDISSKAIMAHDVAGFDWSYMADDDVPTNMALMDFSDSEFNKSEFVLATYKRGLAFVEEQLIFYKKNEVVFCDQIVVLKRDASFRDSKIIALNLQIEKLKKEKESNQIKNDNFENASKSFDKLIGSQITDNRNISYLTDFKEHDGWNVAFGGGAKGGKITGKGTITTGRSPALGFMRPFGCHVSILKTLDQLGKFDGKSDEEIFVGYSITSKAFRVYNIRTRKVKENLHITFLENKPMIVGGGPKWLFDIDALSKSMNYAPVSAGTNSNDFAGKGASFNAGQSSMKTGYSQEYILMPLWKDNSLFDSSSQASDSHNKDKYVNTATPTYADYPNDPLMPDLEDAGIFDNAYDDRDEGAEADYNKLETIISVSPIPSIRIHKDHPKEHIIGEVYRNKRDQRGVVVINKARLVAQCHRQEEGIDYDEVFAHVARIEAISVKSVSTPMETNKPLSKDAVGTDVDVHLYRSMIGSLMYLISSMPDIMFFVCACSRFQVQPKFSHMHAVKRIFRYLKGQPTLGLWYPKDSPLELIAYSDSDYVDANLDRKSTTRGCQFLGLELKGYLINDGHADLVPRAGDYFNTAGVFLLGFHPHNKWSSIHDGMDTCGSPKRQDTMGGTSAQTRSKRVLEQPSEPPLPEGHTSRSGEGRMEHPFELTDYVPPTPHDSPLSG